ncbi:MAG: Ni/Fe hydrogenase subunit alpha [Chloroflexi bacterium]|uniref:Ni/Fe hydrogenase subunit alpha n=1 Tax=Candidatus Chlorohelix allophototropha TaxID=3003348 RepID=A0A8T7LQQ9_9CHLR|nr:Ni/Fe hydrogenase subunit alpha [Chloroflexota bacterium]WJW66267.1 Ni/Fe hydrogenase subunit alpha [Chloroflexota bacterium L227-S17]
MSTKTIKVDYLARVEGEGSLYVKIKDNTVEDVRLQIFEPPRFFEAFLRERDFREVPDITARICGICPVAYQMSSVHALENAFGVKVEGQLRALRRLLYCGEWIESHALHVFMLHAPDFLGYPDSLALSKDYPELVKSALQLKKAGNEIVALVGGREIHPINVKVGGFYRVPRKKELKPLAEKLKQAREIAIQAVKFTATLPIPEFEREYVYVALRHPNEYPYNEGRLVSNNGLDIAISEYETHFREEHVKHSNALHSRLIGSRPYFVGPLARYNLNFDKLSPLAQETALAAGLETTCNNPFKSIIVRAVETLYACDEALRLIAQYEEPDAPAIEVEPRLSSGCGCTEAPRGILYHRYNVDKEGLITEAKIVPPTSQNQKIIEDDLLKFVTKNMNMPTDELTLRCEQAIRNYDPCISCATHFLKLHIERS